MWVYQVEVRSSLVSEVEHPSQVLGVVAVAKDLEQELGGQVSPGRDDVV